MEAVQLCKFLLSLCLSFPPWCVTVALLLAAVVIWGGKHMKGLNE